MVSRKSSGSFRPISISMISMQDFSERPISRRIVSSTDQSSPCGFSAWEKLTLASGSLSTSTPSQSKITSNRPSLLRHLRLAQDRGDIRPEYPGGIRAAHEVAVEAAHVDHPPAIGRKGRQHVGTRRFEGRIRAVDATIDLAEAVAAGGVTDRIERTRIVAA